MSTTWYNIYGCVDQYWYVTALDLISVLAHEYNIITDSCVVSPGHGREVVGGLNDTDKRLISILTTTAELPGVASYDSHMEMHISTTNTNISL